MAERFPPTCEGSLPQPEMVTIKKSVYDRLLASEKELRRLEAAGVDNWDGYSEGFGEEE